MIPTSIDGTDITGATIDGTDVTEITVDGQTVFSAGPSNLPVAYSNLIAWYPFDSATYGGSNVDDVTAILGGSGDDTAYNGIVSNATHQPTGGVKDINGQNPSGALSFDLSSEGMDVPSLDLSNIEGTTSTISWWETGRTQGASLDWAESVGNLTSGGTDILHFLHDGSGFSQFTSPIRNGYTHYAYVLGANNKFTVFEDGVFFDEVAGGPPVERLGYELVFGYSPPFGREYDGTVDDFRVYNTDLSASQINQIYQNTEP